jgi:hypothetical protein
MGKWINVLLNAKLTSFWNCMVEVRIFEIDVALVAILWVVISNHTELPVTVLFFDFPTQ